MSDNSGNNGDDFKGKKLGQEDIVKLAQEYVLLTGGAANENMEMLALFTSVVANYLVETYGLDINRLRFQRAAALIMSMMRAAYGLGASKGLPIKGGVQ